MAETAQDAPIRRFGAFEINFRSGELRKHGIRLRLSGQPLQILAALVERAGEMVTREELQSRVWPAETFVDFDHGLNNAVARIREVLGDSSENPCYVETVPRHGYRFIAPVIDTLLNADPEATTDLAIAGAPAPIRLSEMSSQGELIGAETAQPSPAGKRLLGNSVRIPFLLAIGTACVAFAGLLYRGFPFTNQQAIRSLAVLPLRNLSGDASQEYLADGMTEELVGRLAGISHLRVISRTSVMRFKDTKLPVQEIGNTLGVDALLEGSVIRQGGRVRVHAQLIRAASDEHLWSETYDRQIGDVLTLESDVARSVADRVKITVTGQEHLRLMAARRVAPEVYDCYLRGTFGAHNTRAELEESIPWFQQAIRRDPTFAPAYVGLARIYDNLSLIMVGAPPTEMRPKAITAAQKALALDPDLAEAHLVLADVYQKRWQWRDAEAEYRRALELKPNDASAHLGLANWLMCQGRTEEAIAWAQRARELDPLGTSDMRIGWILFQSRHFGDSVRELRSVLAVQPDLALGRFFLGFALIGNGQPEEAIPELQKLVSLMHRSSGSLELLATAEGFAGHRSEALGLIEEMKHRRQESYIPAGAFINPYLSVRNYDEAFVWFERAYAEQSNILQFLKVHPFFDPVRGDPRFQDLLKRVGLLYKTNAPD